MRLSYFQRLLLRASLLLIGGSALAASDAEPSADASRFTELTRQFLQTAAPLRDYRTVMTKQQRIDGTLGEEEVFTMKQRRADDCRYMKWTGEVHKGREMIYCPQQYDGKVQVHEGGLLGLVTLSLALDSDMLSKSSLRPINESGLFNLQKRVAAKFETPQGKELPSDVQFEQATVHGQAALCATRKGDGGEPAPYPVGRREMCLRTADGLPVRLRLWDRDGQLMEAYTFRDWQLDVGLTDADFDTDNKDYKF